MPLRSAGGIDLYDTDAELDASDPLGQVAITLSPLTVWVKTAASGWVAVGTPSGAAPSNPPASESGQGIVELATEAEVQAGTAGILVATAARLKAEFDRRVPVASETVAGIVELATSAETSTGTDNTRAVHPAGFKAAITPGAWIAPTLLASWVNYGAPYQVAGYRKTPAGEVVLRGTIKNGTITDGTVLFNLPAGYRPASERGGFIGVTGGTGVSRLFVETDGDVAVYNLVGNAQLSLESVRFDV